MRVRDQELGPGRGPSGAYESRRAGSTRQARNRSPDGGQGWLSWVGPAVRVGRASHRVTTVDRHSTG